MRSLILLLSVLIICIIGFDIARAQSDKGTDKKGPVSIEQVNSPGIDNHTEAVKKFGLKYIFTKSSVAASSNSGSGGNSGVIRQFGTDNEAVLKQTGSDNLGMIQMGSSSNFVAGNDAYVNQNGQGMLSIVNMQGNNNSLDFTQKGQNKGAFFNFLGDDLQFNAKQNGSRYQLSPQNSSMPNINVTSTRQTLPVIISNN